MPGKGGVVAVLAVGDALVVAVAGEAVETDSSYAGGAELGVAVDAFGGGAEVAAWKG